MASTVSMPPASWLSRAQAPSSSMTSTRWLAQALARRAGSRPAGDSMRAWKNAARLHVLQTVAPQGIASWTGADIGTSSTRAGS